MHNRRISVFEIFHDAAFPLKDSITGELFYLGTANSFSYQILFFFVMASNENLLYPTFTRHAQCFYRTFSIHF